MVGYGRQEKWEEALCGVEPCSPWLPWSASSLLPSLRSSSLGSPFSFFETQWAPRTFPCSGLGMMQWWCSNPSSVLITQCSQHVSKASQASLIAADTGLTMTTVSNRSCVSSRTVHLRYIWFLALSVLGDGWGRGGLAQTLSSFHSGPW